MILPVGIGPQEGGYQVERSLRFNSADSAYLSRTPASAGNRKTWTWSGWVKRGSLGTHQGLIAASGISLGFFDNNTFFITVAGVGNGTTTALFRDPSAWYHVVIKFDTTQATAANRVFVYINNVNYALNNTLVSQNTDYNINNAVQQDIGTTAASGGTTYFNGYLTEVHFIDGSALDPTSFGEYNTDTGVWQPKAYSGSYGTNGFYLDFADNSSTTALGYDAAGSNDWTPNNFSVTAGAGNDSLVDTPTNYGTDTGAGGEVRGNYCTLNPLTIRGATGTLSNGNLTVAASSASSPADTSMYATIALPSTGLIYLEALYTVTAGTGNDTRIGVSTVGDTGAYVQAGSTTGYWSYDYKNGTANAQGSNTSYTAASTGQVVMWAIDVANGRIWAGANGTWFNSGNPAAGTGAVLTGVSASAINLHTTLNGWINRCQLDFNFGARPFAYSAPSGFKALCTQNLPEPTVVDGGEYFNTVLYTGNGSTQSITGVGFQPDWVWVKKRSGAENHELQDAVRGAGKRLASSTTDAEANATAISSFNADGFSVGAYGTTNESSYTYAAWNWKANGAGVSNTDGTITSTVSANTTAGFSIVTYTGTGSNATVGHGLGVAPRFIIARRRDNVVNWFCYHSALAAGEIIQLNLTNAKASVPTAFNSGTPTSTTFPVGADSTTNASGGLQLAYCFAPVAGYSAFGSVSMNGSADGSFIYTGFLPKLVLLKRSDSTSNWIMWDTVRNTYNVVGAELYPNLSNAESTVTDLDILSNGFKMRNSGFSGTWIYAAWAEVPFRYSLAR